MKDHANLIEPLIERVAAYGKTSLELLKLNAIDKSSDIASTAIPQSVILYFIASILLFSGLGLAVWLGEITGKTYLGFFIVAAFYILAGLFFYLFIFKWLKRVACDYFIRQVLK